MRLELGSEDALTDAAARVAQRWRDAGIAPLVVGLRGALGSGKTTWVRAMLRGLGYQARVPSPTYTLVEEYPVGKLTIVHVDLYRLTAAEELEFLGIRDRIAADAWLLVEWPERAAALMQRCDLVIDFVTTGPEGRRLALVAQSAVGGRAVDALSEVHFK